MATTASDHLDTRFKQAAHGVRWAFSTIPGSTENENGLFVKDIPLTIAEPKAVRGDSYSVRFRKSGITVTAGTAVGVIGGLLAAAEQVRTGKTENVTLTPAFKTRNYKHEIAFETRVLQGKRPPRHKRRAITDYSDAFIETFMQQIVSRHFNGFVLYAGYHPFDFFLDYKGYPGVSDNSAALRKRNFSAMKRLLSMAKKYGLRTFLHHYCTHFTQALADKLKLGIKSSGTRLANYDHPAIFEYGYYIYRRTFETLPELDGLYMNFESSQNAAEFLEKTLLKAVNDLGVKPMLFYRLWGFSDVDAMKRLIRSYNGPSGLVHKGHDTSDTYYYPIADARVKIWKKAMPDVEFMFSIGPCHNCGTVVSDKVWTDPDYIHAFLKDAQQKGADSISFQSSNELLLNELPDTGGFSPFAHDFARANIGHMEAVVDYVRGQKPSKREWAARYAKWYDTTPDIGEIIRSTIVISSQIVLKYYLQFNFGSAQEGYIYPGRFSAYQEPFFYFPASFLNRLGEIPHHVRWRAWAVRKTKVKVVENDTQAVIDYVNPAVKEKPVNHPEALIRQIKQLVAKSLERLQAYKKKAGKKANAFLIAQIERNARFGARAWREIAIAIKLYSCYYSNQKRMFFQNLKRARDLMLDAHTVLGDAIKDTNQYLAAREEGPFTPKADADKLSAIIKHEADDFPFAALAEYMISHERYNEIRRLNRPYISVREEMAARNLKLLKQSLTAAQKAVGLLGAEKHALYRDNVMAWIEYIRAEIDWLTPPAMAVRPDDAIDPKAGFRKMVRDTNYRWGEPCWDDIGSFFTRHDFFGNGVLDCRVTTVKSGLKISLREHEIVWADRIAVWDRWRGTINQTGFMRAFIDVGNTGKRVIDYCVYFQGDGGTVSAFMERPDGEFDYDKPSTLSGCPMHFDHTDSNWRFDMIIPWKQLGTRAPKPGDIWRFNIFSNPEVVTTGRYIWCQGYEYTMNDVARLGHIVFEND